MTRLNLEDVKSCPFCGGKDIDIYELSDTCGRNTDYKVECFNEKCEPYHKTEKEAIAFWNTRRKNVKKIDKKVV